MAASIARKIAALLFALAMVGSVAVGPALADDDGDVSVGGDGVSVGGDDGTTVSAGDDGSANGSTTVSADADEDGVDADASVSGGDGSGTDGSLDCGVDTGSQDASCEPSGTDGDSEAPGLNDAPEAPDDGDAPEDPDAPNLGGSGDDGGDGDSAAPPTTMDEISTPEVPIESPDLPVNYEEDVPFEAFPDFCNPPYGVDDVREANPVDPTEPTEPLPGAVKEQLPEEAQDPVPETPVGNPLGLVGVPVDQCDVFNPYDPAVNPTSPPDDPSATVNPQSTEPGQDGVLLFWRSDATADEEERSPGAETLKFVKISQDRSRALLMADGTNGKTNSGGSAYVSSPNDPSRIDGTATAMVFGQGASLSLDCNGSECKPSAGGVPSGGAVPAFPAAGGDDGGEDSEPDPSADTGEPDILSAGEDGVIIVDDRRATLGDGLPGGDNEARIILAEDRQRVQQDAQASGNGRQANLETTYEGGQYPGDDDVYVLAKGDGAGVIVGLNCDDYRCSPAENTGVYPGPASMIFEMLPDPPEGAPSP
jgi:hypothetical protein